MPTYEYACKTCGHVFEHVQPISARPLRTSKCAECKKSRPVQRLISGGGGLLFKGSGFYLTDYRSEGYKKAAKAETTPSSTSASSTPADSKASKPAAESPSSKSTPSKEPSPAKASGTGSKAKSTSDK